MIASLIDFSFIRSLVAHRYSDKGPPCYDPPTLFMLDLFRHIDDHNDMSRFCEILRNQNRGRSYRLFAGINAHIPCEATFSNFRARLGTTLYNEIFHVLVGIFHQLEMITVNILAHDGTLYPTWARYKGYTYFCDQCSCITVDDVIGKVKNRILYRLNIMAEKNMGSEILVYVQCPSTRFPEDVKKPELNCLPSSWPSMMVSLHRSKEIPLSYSMSSKSWSVNSFVSQNYAPISPPLTLIIASLSR